MIRKNFILEFLFRGLTILFWFIFLYNWILIPHININLYIFIFYTVIALFYLVIFSIDKIQDNSFKKRDIDFLYRFISISTFIVYLLSILLFSNSLKILFLKFILTLIYFYISYKKAFKLKQEEGLVGIISSILLFTFDIYY